MVESRDKTKVVFHKGTHTIGGTLVEVAYKKSRIFFDLGAVFDPQVTVLSLDDLLENKLVTYVDGLYDPRAFDKPVREKEDSYSHQAAFISHAHLDHTSIINFTNPTMDLYASADTVKVLEAMSVDDDFIFPFSKNQEKSKKNIRPIKGLSYFESVDIGDLKVTLIPVDHDAYGACGFLIESPRMTIAYTGDIRSHGFRPDLTETFIEKVKGADLLISEGVSFSFYKLGEDDQEENLSEKEVVGEFERLLKENKDRQLTFSYYPTNFERIREIYEKTKDLRKLVLTSFNAYLVKEVLGFDLPYYKISEKDYGLDPKLEISLDELLEDRGEYLWQMDVKKLDLIDYLEEKSLYIHSDAEPLGDFDPFYQIFLEKLEKKNIDLALVKSSGHAKTRDLYQIISKINPKLLAPIHSFNPEWVYYYSDRLLNPSDGDVIIF